MIKVERALFSNVISAVQRTANLPGGGVRGIPGGVVIKGLDGVASFGADIQEAQKEYEKGRIRTSLERVRQLDAQFQGISSRWESTANNVLSSARSGTDQIPMQKLNEVKNAQTKMAQLTRPAAKAFQDLVTALETAVANEGREQADEEAEADEQAAKDAAAVLNPTYFKKSLLLVLVDSKDSLSPKNSSTGMSSTNSFCLKASTMESLGFNSASLFQYFLFDAIRISLRFFFNSDIYRIPNRPS